MESVESTSLTKVKIWVDILVNCQLFFNTKCDDQLNQPSKKKTACSLSHAWFETLYRANKSPICVKPQPLKSCLKIACSNPEPEGCSLVSTICNTFPSQRFSQKTLPNYLNMYTLDWLQMIPFMHGDPPLSQNSVWVHIYARICSIRQTVIPKCSALISWAKTKIRWRWILVNHLQLYFWCLNTNVLLELLGESLLRML